MVRFGADSIVNESMNDISLHSNKFCWYTTKMVVVGPILQAVGFETLLVSVVLALLVIVECVVGRKVRISVVESGWELITIGDSDVVVTLRGPKEVTGGQVFEENEARAQGINIYREHGCQWQRRKLQNKK